MAKRRDPEPEASTLPTITAADVRALRDAGRLAHVEVYPLPDLRAPGAAPAAAFAPPAPPVRLDAAPPASPAADQPAPREAAPAPALEKPKPGTEPLALRLDDGRVIAITGTGVVGRAPAPKNGELSVTIDDPRRSLSRTHLRFELDRAGRVFVVDLESANGTELVTAGGFRTECLPGRRYRVNADDVVLIGEFALNVERAAAH